MYAAPLVKIFRNLLSQVVILLLIVVVIIYVHRNMF
jgi:hypothetical protein